MPFQAQRGEKAGGCRADKREGNLGAGSGLAAGDRCRGFGKGQGFPLQNPFKQRREPDPREGIGTAKGPQRGPQLKGWGKRDGRQQGVEGGKRRVLRAKGKEAGGFPSCFHRLSQALLHAPPQWS